MNRSRYNRFSEFVVLETRFGSPTVQHVPSGLLVHSRMDPVAEASMIAESLTFPSESNILLIGGGLGYLADEILHRTETQPLYVLEPFPELLCLAEHFRPNSNYLQSARCQKLLITTALTTQHAVFGLKEHAFTCISPYLPPLAENCRHPLSGLLQLFRAEKASKSIYSSIISDHERSNHATMDTLPKVCDHFGNDTREKIVCGAGPSLSLQKERMIRNRGKFCIIAASGAVPSLLAMGITPDWCVAMEALPSALNDLCGLPVNSRIIVFEFSFPGIVSNKQWMCYSATLPKGGSLETRGGTSVIPALDFAIHLSSSPIYLCGVDLTNRSGAYAHGANREEILSTSNDMPKFAAMRIGLESLIFRRKSQIEKTKIFHVTSDGVVRLRGTDAIRIEEKLYLLNHTLHMDSSHA